LNELRLQVQGREGFPVKYSSVFQCAYQVAKEEGIGSFWRGSMCSFMKVLLPPAACLILGHIRAYV
jgi:hypothetical protein